MVGYFQVPLLATFSLSSLLNTLFHLIGPSIDLLILGRRPVNRFTISSIYTVVFFVNYMLFWSSFWKVFSLTITTIPILIISAVLSIGVLLKCGCFNTVNGVPASVVVDTGKNHCTSTTLLRVPSSFLFSSLFINYKQNLAQFCPWGQLVVRIHRIWLKEHHCHPHPPPHPPLIHAPFCIFLSLHINTLIIPIFCVTYLQ